MQFDDLSGALNSAAQSREPCLDIGSSDLEQWKFGWVVRGGIWLDSDKCDWVVYLPPGFCSYVGGQQLMDARAGFRGTSGNLFQSVDGPDSDPRLVVAELLDSSTELFIGLRLNVQLKLRGAGIKALSQLVSTELQLTPGEVGAEHQKNAAYTLE